MKILHLTLKKKWFDLIASGEKKIEYREGKPYWIKRLVTPGVISIPLQFDEVHFKNGYRKDSPLIKVQWKGLSCIVDPKRHIPKCGEVLDPNLKYYGILLGDII